MLILNRTLENDTILIGDDIKIRILSVKGYQVKIGIEAPIEINIVREELLLREKTGFLGKRMERKRKKTKENNKS
jgi:carbon storage regulator